MPFCSKNWVLESFDREHDDFGHQNEPFCQEQKAIW